MVHRNGSDSHSGDSRYEDLFLLFSTIVEKWLKRVLIGGLAVLLAAQCLLQIPVFRYYLVKVEQLEGAAFNRSYE